MKKMLCVLVLTLGWLVSVAQQEIIYGTPRADGYEKITKGAFWSTRPEAKMVEEGSIPPGCTVDVLTEQYYVRFVDAEHNQNDDNYIIFPVGSKIYTKGGKYYSAKCGNEIEYLRPVNMVKIIEKEKIVEVEKPAPKPEKEKPVVVQDTVYKMTVVEETRYEDDVYYRPQMQMGVYWQIRPMMQNGLYGRPFIVDNRTYISNYQNNSNYSCNRTNTRPPVTEPPHASGPGGRGDEGNHASGPGGRADGNDNGGHASGSDGSSNGNYNSSGSGGRSAYTRDGMGRITNSSVQTSSNLKSASVRSTNPTMGMVTNPTSSRRYSSYNSNASGVNTRLANRISGGTSAYNQGTRRAPNTQTQNRSFNPSSIRTSSGMSNRGNGLMSGPTMGRR